MWWPIVLIGVPFVGVALYGAFDSWRRLHGIRRVTGVLGGIFLAVGGGAFFSIGLAAHGAIPATFEWPIGHADQILELTRGLQVASHTPSGRIQIYDTKWRFVRGWTVDASGGVFKFTPTGTGNLEVWTARGQKRLVFTLEGSLVEAGSYAPADYSSFEVPGRSGYVPTFLPLWIFAHPFVAWAVGVVGMAALALSDPERFKSKRRGA